MSQNQVTSSLNNNTNADVNQMDDIDARNGMKRDSKKDGATFIIRQHGDRNKINGNHNDNNDEDVIFAGHGTNISKRFK